VCRKREDLTWVAEWDELRERVVESARLQAGRLLRGGMPLNRVDIGVITMAKCLEHSLRHVPQVLQGDRRLEVGEILAEGWRLAEELAVDMEADYPRPETLKRHLLETQAKYG